MPFGINYCDTHDSALHIKLDTNNGRLKIKNGQRLCTTVTHGRWHGDGKTLKHRKNTEALRVCFVVAWDTSLFRHDNQKLFASSFFLLLRGVFFYEEFFFLQGIFFYKEFFPCYDFIAPIGRFRRIHEKT